MHVVCVVWERETISETSGHKHKFVPYSSRVSQLLERTFGKKLTRVLLSDADCSLEHLYVNLRTLQECSENPDTPLANVRRKFYAPASPAGKGINWEYSNGANKEWASYDMELQCVIEEAWAKGNQTIDLAHINLPYTINFYNLTQVRHPNGPIRNIRRTQQAPYPLTKIPLLPNSISQPSLAIIKPTASNNNNSKSIIGYQQQNQSSSVPKLNHISDSSCYNYSSKSAPTSQYGGHGGFKKQAELYQSDFKKPIPVVKPKKNQNSATGNCSDSTTSTTKLARQILNNLNIFSHHHADQKDKEKTFTNTKKKSLCKTSHASSMLEIDSTSINSRRPSVDTVSTYLSHESRISHAPSFGSVSDLLNCSISSDDVFLPSSIGTLNMIIKGSIVGVDTYSDHISKFVCVVDPPQFQPCPICLNELRRESNAKNPTVTLSRCQHLMHLNCLNELILSQKNDNEKSVYYIECPTCRSVYGEKIGNQPPGTMTWKVIPKSLPGYEGNTIQIVYNIVSGIQSKDHPHPGRSFFAVGFPRVCYLPEEAGRNILRYLKIAFDRRLLFSIGRSTTTGREDVVIWNSVDHKTQFSMFPDPGYMQRVIEQLIHLGVTD